MSDVAQRYIDTWNETDPERRRAALGALYAEDAAYTDPTAQLRGVSEIDAFIAATRERFPGMRFKLAGSADSHHNLTRFVWHAGPAGAEEPAVIGFDVLVGDEEGAIREVCGFIDRAPAA